MTMATSREVTSFTREIATIFKSLANLYGYHIGVQYNHAFLMRDDGPSLSVTVSDFEPGSVRLLIDMDNGEGNYQLTDADYDGFDAGVRKLGPVVRALKVTRSAAHGIADYADISQFSTLFSVFVNGLVREHPRTAAAKDTVKSGMDAARLEFQRINSLRGSMKYMADRVLQGGKRESVDAFKQRVSKQILELVTQFDALGLDKAEAELDAAIAVVEEVLERDSEVALDDMQSEYMDFADGVLKTSDDIVRKLRDLEVKHPELSGYAFDDLVGDIEAMADDAHGVRKQFQ